MNIEPAFFCPIATDTLELDNTAMKNYCLDLKNQSTGRVKSNRGGWQSPDVSGYIPELNQLFIEIIERANKLHETMGYKSDRKQNFKNAWINVNGTGSFNLPHSHPEAIFSGVYYIDCKPNSGDIVFMNPQAYFLNDNLIEKFTPFLSCTRSYQPEIGKLILFPAWLTHYVESNLASEERISIAFNTYIEKPEVVA
jgi:uncharacterized protein (TIGR02466 family)